MTKKELVVLTEQLLALERRIKPLEWDFSRNQINEFRRQQLERLQAEHTSLKEKITELQG